MQSIEKTIAACIKNDRKEQKKLYEYCFHLFIGLCMRYYVNKEDAISAFQSGMLRVMQNIDQYKPQTNFNAWAKQVIIRSVLNDLKSKKSYREALISDNNEHAITYASSNLDHDLDAESLLELMEQLPERERLVLNLYAIDGYSHKEISNLLGFATGTSRWLLSQARNKMKELLAKEKESTQKATA